MVLLGYSGKQDVVQEASDLKEFHFKNIMLQDIFVSLKINSVCLVYVIWWKKSSRFIDYHLYYWEALWNKDKKEESQNRGKPEFSI